MINAAFKVFWNNPIELTTETSLQELEFNLPLGAIIADPNISVDLSNYYTKPETDILLTDVRDYVDLQNSLQDDVISLKADISYVDNQNSIQNTVINSKADTTYVNSQNSAQDLIIATKATKVYVDAENAAQNITIALKADKTYVDNANTTQDNAIALKADKTYVDSEIISTKSYADSKVAQTITDGVITSAPSQDAVRDALLLKQNLPTGFVSGWELSIDPLDNTKFRINVGGGVVTDFTDVFNIKPTIKQTSVMMSGLSPQFLATHPASYIAFDKDLNVVQSSSPFTNQQRRTLIILGSVIHSNNINVNVTNEIKAPIVAPTNQLHDFILAVGAMNLNGNEIVPNGNNLNINITAGSIWKMGINANDLYNPHILGFSLRTAPTFAYRLRNSTEYASSALLDPLNYDLNGVRTSLSNNNRWSIQRFYLFQSGLVRAQYGQAEYSSYQNAVNALLSEPFSTEQNIKDNGLIIARIIMKKTCTNLLSDIQAGIASIHVSDKFGNTSSASTVTAEAITGALGYTPANVRKTANLQSSNYTLQISDAANIVRTTGASTTNITVPNSSTTAFTAQDRIEIEWYGTGQPTVVGAAGVTIRVLGSGTLALPAQYSKVTLEYVGSNEWIMFKEDTGASGSSTPVWTDITTLGSTTLYAGLNLAQTKIELSKINGFLWIRGVYTSGAGGVTASGEVFRVTNTSWFVNTSSYTFISNPVVNVIVLPVGAGVNQHKLQQVTFPYTGMSFFAGSSVAANTPVLIPPTCVGMSV